MATFLRERLAFGARAISLRLRLASMLRSGSLPALLKALTRAPRGPKSAVPLDVVEQSIAASEGVARRIPAVPDTCLYRALARYAVLVGAGYPARFVMGIEPSSAALSGHAWVELDGASVGETLDPGLVITYSYPKPPRPRHNASGPSVSASASAP